VVGSGGGWGEEFGGREGVAVFGEGGGGAEGVWGRGWVEGVGYQAGSDAKKRTRHPSFEVAARRILPVTQACNIR